MNTGLPYTAWPSLELLKWHMALAIGHYLKRPATQKTSLLPSTFLDTQSLCCARSDNTVYYWPQRSWWFCFVIVDLKSSKYIWFNHWPFNTPYWDQHSWQHSVSSERRLDSKIIVPEGISFDTHEWKNQFHHRMGLCCLLIALHNTLSGRSETISSYTSQKSEAELAYTGFGIIIASS